MTPTELIRFPQRPRAVLFDLFHTLASVPPPAMTGDVSLPQILGVPAGERQRRYYDEDVLGRCVGREVAADATMRGVTRGIDPREWADRNPPAVRSRRRRF